MNDFSQLDAQDEMSRLAQVIPEESSPDFSALSEDDIDNLEPEEYEAFLSWFEKDIEATITESKKLDFEQTQSVLTFLEAMNILEQCHVEIKKRARVLLAGERGGVQKFRT